MRGKKTDKTLIDEIYELMVRHRPAEIVTMMDGRLPKRTVYRIIANLRKEDERRKLEQEERFQEQIVQRTMSRLKILQSRKQYRKVSDFPAGLRRVRSF